MQALKNLIKQGGQLVQVGDSLEQKASEIGSNTPVTPLGAATIGGEEHQAKMAGTPVQKLGSIQKQKLDAPKSFGDVAALGEKEKGKVARGQQLNLLTAQSSNLDSRVESLVISRIKSAQEGLTGDETKVRDTTIKSILASSGLTTDNDKKILTALLKNETPANANWADFGAAIGIADAHNMTADAIQTAIRTKYLDPKTGILANQIQSNMSVKDLYDNPDTVGVEKPDDFWKSLGFAGEADVQQFLGISSLGEANLKQVKDSLSAKVSSDFSEVQAAQAAMQDPAASWQEQEEARRTLARLGGQGIRAAEVSAKEASKSLEKANRVTFNGKEFDVDELLKGEEFKKAAQNFNNLTKEKQAELLNGPDKEFYKLVESSAKALGEREKASESALNKVQASSDSANKAYSNLKVSPETFQKIYGISNSVSFGAGMSDATRNSSLLALAGRLEVPLQQNLGNFLNALSTTSPETAIRLGQLTDADLSRMGINPAASPQDVMTQLQNYAQEYKISKALADAPDDVFLSVIGADIGALDNLLPQLAEQLKTTGVISGKANKLMQLFDRDHDGNKDSPAAIRARLKKEQGNINDWKVGKEGLGSVISGTIGKATEQQKEWASRPEWQKDNQLSEGELNSLSPGDLQKILQNPPKGLKIPDSVRNKADDIIVTDTFNKNIAGTEAPSFNPDEFGWIDGKSGESISQVQNNLNTLNSKLEEVTRKREALKGVLTSRPQDTDAKNRRLDELERLQAAIHLRLTIVENNYEAATGSKYKGSIVNQTVKDDLAKLAVNAEPTTQGHIRVAKQLAKASKKSYKI